MLGSVINLYVHFNDSGRCGWEDWEHRARAAASGEVTTVADMPINSLPALTDTAFKQLLPGI